MRTPEHFGTPREDRLRTDWKCLSNFRNRSLPGWTRRPFTDEFRAARTWLTGRMLDAGLKTEVDAAGNLIGRRLGRRADLRPIVIGSHTDTVVGGGRFDGIVGVVGALEVARCLSESEIFLDHPLEIVDFLAEEPTDFGISTVGSRAISGTLSPEMLARRNAAGETLGEAITSVGGLPSDIGRLARPKGSVALYLELHIEQGPVLERERVSVGVVTAITGVSRFRIEVTGRPDHAGGTPMSERRDALTGAADVVLALERLWQDGDGVGTTGRLNVVPNATNVVPGKVEMWTDMRSIAAARLSEASRLFPERVRDIGIRRDLAIEIDLLSFEAPVVIAEDVQDRLEAAGRHLGISVRRLPSYAGHDANQMAKIAPIGVLFVPSRGGRSHCAEEWTGFADVTQGVRVLAEALLEFDETE